MFFSRHLLFLQDSRGLMGNEEPELLVKKLGDYIW